MGYRRGPCSLCPIHRGPKDASSADQEPLASRSVQSVLFSVILILSVSAARTLCPVLEDWEARRLQTGPKGAATELRAPGRPHLGPKDPAPLCFLSSSLCTVPVLRGHHPHLWSGGNTGGRFADCGLSSTCPSLGKDTARAPLYKGRPPRASVPKQKGQGLGPRAAPSVQPAPISSGRLPAFTRPHLYKQGQRSTDLLDSL